MTSIIARMIALLLVFAATLWAYLRVFRGAGMITFLTAALMLHALAVFVPVGGIVVGFGAIVFLIFFENEINKKKKMYQGLELIYEGGGIRRGLYAVEVSLLFQQPKEIQYLIALIGMLEKKLISIDQALRVNIADWLEPEIRGLNPAARSEFRQAKALTKSIILNEYEEVLIELFQLNSKKKVNLINFDLWSVVLNKNLALKIEGYDLARTKTYYLEFISHRINKIWINPEDRLANLSWFVFGLQCNQFDTNYLERFLADFRPAWVPDGLNFIEFMNIFHSE